MSVEVRWIHHASFRLSAPGCVLYIDPWKIAATPHDADVVFISHSHFDHCSPPDVEKVSRADTTVVAPAETVKKLHRASAVDPGQELSLHGVTIEAVAAYNIGKAFHPRDNHWCGAVFTLAGKRVYYAGDTDQVPEMSDLKDVDLALLPVGGTYTLDARQAAQACRTIGCKAAVPYHWGDVVGSLADAESFSKLAGCKVHLLREGQSVTL